MPMTRIRHRSAVCMCPVRQGKEKAESQSQCGTQAAWLKLGPRLLKFRSLAALCGSIKVSTGIHSRSSPLLGQAQQKSGDSEMGLPLPGSEKPALLQDFTATCALCDTLEPS